MFLYDAKPQQTATFAPTVEGLAEKDRAADRLWDATRELQLFRDNTNAHENARAEAYERRNRAIFDATGVQLGNPYRATEEELARTVRDRRFSGTRGFKDTRDRAERKWLADVQRLSRERPEFSRVIAAERPIGEDAFAVARDAEQEFGQASAAAGELSGMRRLGNTLGGGIAGMLRDPLQVATLFAGGGLSTARSVGARILQVVLTEAAVNGGVEAAVQAASHDWKKQAGVEHGLGPALTQVGLATAFGGGFGGLLAGGREVFRALGRAAPEEALQRAASGQPEPGDIEAIATAAGVALPPEQARMAAIAQDQAALDRAAFGAPPDGMDGKEAERLAADALRQAEDPPETPRMREIVRSQEVSRAPGNFSFFDPAELTVDAARFQFKAGGDDVGVTDRLKGVRQWNPERAGVLVVFEDGAGRRFVADGHQRTGLAKRISAETGETIELPGYVFRESDGYSAEDVRAIAALKNIAEGSGSSLDAAKVLRTGKGGGDAVNLPPSSALVRDAAGLARLSDDAFAMAVNEVVKPQLAAVVGRLADNPALHADMLSVLKKEGAASIGEAESMVRDMTAAATVRETQSSLFGAEEVERMMLKERAQIRQAALSALKRDKAVFNMLADEEARVSSAGNVLDTVANRERAAEDAVLVEIIEKLSHRAGPVADAFNAAARSVAGGERAAGAARAFVGAVRDEIERAGGDLGRIGGAGPQDRPLKPAGPLPEPATSEAAEIAELALTEARRSADPDETATLNAADIPSLFRALPQDIDAWDDLRIELIKARPDLAAAVLDAMDAAPARARPGDSITPEMTAAHNAERVSAGDALKSYLEGGGALVLPSAARPREIRGADMIELRADGPYFRSGRNWIAVTDDQIDVMMAQAGAPPLPRRWAAASEIVDTMDGPRQQALIPGVKPVTTKERLEAEAAKPMRGGDKAPPEGGLFDLEGQKQIDMWDAMPGAKTADGQVLHATHETMIAEADRDELFADLIASCKD